MTETLIWAGGLAIEALLVAAVMLTVLLRRSRKIQQQLLAQLAEKEKSAGDAAIVEVPAEAPKQIPEEPAAEIEPVESKTVEIGSVEIEKAAVEAREIATSLLEPALDADETELADAVAEPAKTIEASAASEFDQLRKIVDSANLDISTAQLQQRLDVTHDSLQRLALDLEQDPGSGTVHPEIATLQGNLQEMTSQVDSLQESSARLQRDLRDKTDAIEQTFAEKHEVTERELHHAKKLRRDMTALREKLKHSESDVQKLQTEKEVLAAEYAALNSEYERIYANSAKK